MHSSDPLDTTIIALFLAMIILVPLAGYVFMVLDFRAYLRSLRRVVIVATQSFTTLPGWARVYTPRCIAALGLQMPCTEEDLKRAYRQKVKELHPDHGGDQRRFMILQAQFEEALKLVAEQDRATEHAPL
jgi:hypothetical protein